MDNSRVTGIIGPVGSAKSTGSAKRVGRHIFEQAPGAHGIAMSRWVVVRNTTPQLNDTTIKTWLQVFPPSVYGKYESTKKMQTWDFVPRGGGKRIRAEIQFRALDDVDSIPNLLSLEATGFWLNEAREIDPDLIGHILARVGRYPSAGDGGCTYSGVILDSNPWDYTSKWHENFKVNPLPGWKLFEQPGGMSADAENLANLNQTAETLKLEWDDPIRQEQGRGYYRQLLTTYSPADADMYIHSKYGASRNGKPVYVSFNDNTHIKTFEYDSTRALLIGYDCTGRTPAAIIAQRTIDGQWRILYEFVIEGMGMKQHAAELRRFIASELPGATIERITCDPAGIARDSGELDMLQIVRNEFRGVTVLKARTNDIATRIEAVDGPLRKLVNGEPAVIIHPRCKVLRTACISEYHYRRLKVSGKERYTEEPEKISPYADIADALQYLMLGGGEGRIEMGAGSDWTRDGTINVGRIWSPLDA
jgi:hypothetical protein